MPLRIAVRGSPDPFNPITSMHYELPQDGFVEVAIFGARGQRIRTLLREHQQAGSRSVVWVGTGDVAGLAASGIYWVRMVSGGTLGTDRLTLVR